MYIFYHSLTMVTKKGLVLISPGVKVPQEQPTIADKGFQIQAATSLMCQETFLVPVVLNFSPHHHQRSIKSTLARKV